MLRSMRRMWVVHSLILLLVLVGTYRIPTATAQGATLTVFAAASLADVFEEIGAAFEAQNPGAEVLFSFAGSSDLAAQLAEGAPADIFASANNAQMQAARDAGRIRGLARVFAQNRLVVIVPTDNPAGITSLRDLANPGVRLVVAAPAVPVRTYTDTMLERLAADPVYGESYRTAVLANIVSEEQNVRQVAAKIALGEGDAGIVYVSDITPDIRDQVTAVVIPDDLNTIAAYPIAITNDTPHRDLARAFVRYVLSDAGQDALARWNFIPARDPHRD